MPASGVGRRGTSGRGQTKSRGASGRPGWWSCPGCWPVPGPCPRSLRLHVRPCESPSSSCVQHGGHSTTSHVHKERQQRPIWSPALASVLCSLEMRPPHRISQAPKATRPCDLWHRTSSTAERDLRPRCDPPGPCRAGADGRRPELNLTCYRCVALSLSSVICQMSWRTCLPGLRRPK